MFIWIAISLLAAPMRLPAPISEIAPQTPTPAAQTETPKPKTRPTSSAASEAPAPGPFAGTWKGLLTISAQNGRKDARQCTIRISNDQKTVEIELADKGDGSGRLTERATGLRRGKNLTWQVRQPTATTVCTLELRGANSLSYVRTDRFTSGELKGGVVTSTATLSK
jgi:hypothetical protein